MREKVESKWLKGGSLIHKRARVHNNLKSEDLILKRKVDMTHKQHESSSIDQQI